MAESYNPIVQKITENTKYDTFFIYATAPFRVPKWLNIQSKILYFLTIILRKLFFTYALILHRH